MENNQYSNSLLDGFGEKCCGEVIYIVVLMWAFEFRVMGVGPSLAVHMHA